MSQPATLLRTISQQLLAGRFPAAPDVPRVTAAPAAGNLPPYLTQAEIAHHCTPLTQPAAQIRHLRRMGMHVEMSRNGRPVVARSEFERVMTGGHPTEAANDPGGVQPDADALKAFLTKRKRHGTQKKTQ